MEFKGFLGNESIKNLLSQAFAEGHFPHAILLEGEKGTGKRTFSKLLAKALVCEGTSSVPCDKCPACIRANAGSHPDIRIEEGSGATRSLSVDTIKAVSEDAYRMPEEASVNVYILSASGRFPEISQNKLLKLIEEPPPSSIFIITCENSGQLLPTILSRVQTYKLDAPRPEVSAEYISEKKGISYEAAMDISRIYQGNIGKILEKIDDKDAGVMQETVADIVNALLSTDDHRILSVTAPFIKDRLLFRDILLKLMYLFRDACILRAGADNCLSGMENEAEKLCVLPRKVLYSLSLKPDEYIKKLDRNANMSLLVTAFCAELKYTVMG